MECPSCGTEVREGQKFCMECGASLRGISDVTGEVPVPGREPASNAGTEATAQLRTFPPPSGAPADQHAADQHAADQHGTDPYEPTRQMAVEPDAGPDAMATVPLHIQVQPEGPVSPARTPLTTPAAGYRSALYDHAVERDLAPADAWGPGVIDGEVLHDDVDRHDQATRRRITFRPRLLLLLAVVAAGATAAAVLAQVIEIEPDQPGAPFPIGGWIVNDFGTNNAVAGLIAAGLMVVGALLWCFGLRWGAGLAGGAGGALAGWAALLVGLAEWPIAQADAAGATDPATVTRDIGYWAVVGAGVIGLLALVASFAAAGRDGRSGLDPWIAALGAVAFLVAAGGPLIPEGTARFSGNYASTSLAVEPDLPTAFFAGRFVQLGLLALCGVVGFLLVRRFGLGLAVGAGSAAGWMVATAAVGQTSDPIGPAFTNPGAVDTTPHAVTIVGMALVGFFALVAIVMALLDTER